MPSGNSRDAVPSGGGNDLRCTLKVGGVEGADAAMGSLLLVRRNEGGLRLLTFFEAEEDGGLLEEEVLPLLRGDVEPTRTEVRVHVTDRVLDPLVPRLLRDLLVDAFAELV